MFRVSVVLWVGCLGGAEMSDLLNWFATGRVGASSRTMACHFMGVEHDGSYPYDPDDLNRCLLLLDAVPEIREHMNKIAEINNVWAALVDRWGEIEQTFLEEVGLNWIKGSSAPRTYKLMKDTIDGAIQ
jgi:hypothetical protein